jgi:hypothetical protein
MEEREVYGAIGAAGFERLIAAFYLEWAPKLRQPVKTHFSLNGEEGHEPISTKVHERV